MRARIAAVVLPLLAAIPVLGAEGYAGGVSSKLVLKTTTTNSGQRIGYPVTDRAEVTAMTVEIAPGASTGWHTHLVPVYAWVVAGSLIVERRDGKTSSYAAGDVIVEAVNTPHNGRNAGAEAVKLLVLYTGAEGTPNVVRIPERPEAP